MTLLRLLALRKIVDFIAWYEKGIFCGVSYLVSDEHCVFILYLAVNDDIRSRGYGSRILSEVKKRYAHKNIFLNVERPDDHAKNALQREKRITFYEKNGFHKTNAFIHDGSQDYLVMSLHESYHIDDYKHLLKRFSFGFLKTDF